MVKTKTVKMKTIVFISMVVVSVFAPAYAQQTIFNVPSSEVLDKRKVYFELDAGFKTNNQEAARRFSSFIPRVVAGIGRNVEVGLNLTGNVNPGADATTLVPAIKWRAYNSEKKAWQSSSAIICIFRFTIALTTSATTFTRKSAKPSKAKPVDCGWLFLQQKCCRAKSVTRGRTIRI
jgi:hypothetical protein